MPTDKRERQRAGRDARRQAAREAQRRAARRRQIISIIALLGVVVAIGLAINLTGSDDVADVAAGSSTTTAKDGDKDEPKEESGKIGTAPCPPAEGAPEPKKSFDGRPQKCLADGATYAAVVETDIGSFTIDLDHEKAPNTVNNFVFLARYRAYEDVPFHRVIPGFVVQGGDVESGSGSGGPGYKFADELPKAGQYRLGSVAMANSGPDTNGSQFFVITGEQGIALPPNYSLFGQVSSGLDVVKKIEADGAESGTPKIVHKIVKVTINEKE